MGSQAILFRGLLHGLEFAEAATRAALQAGTAALEHGYDIHRTKLRQAGRIGKFPFETQAGAAVGQGVAIDFPAIHHEIDRLVVPHIGGLDGDDLDAIDRIAGGDQIIRLGLGDRGHGGADQGRAQGHGCKAAIAVLSRHVHSPVSCHKTMRSTAIRQLLPYFN